MHNLTSVRRFAVKRRGAQRQGAAADGDPTVAVVADLDRPDLGGAAAVQRLGGGDEANARPHRSQVVHVDFQPEGHLPRGRGDGGPHAGHALGQGDVHAAVEVSERLKVTLAHFERGAHPFGTDLQVLDAEGAVEARALEKTRVEFGHPAILCQDTGVETIAYLPGYLSPPSGFRMLVERLEGYAHVELERRPTPAAQLEAWSEALPQDAHLVASFEAGLAAVRLAVEKRARSLVWFSPYARGDAALKARARALDWALDRGGLEGFVEVARPLLFGSLMLERGEELIAAWREGLEHAGLAAWARSLAQLGDERKWLRTLDEVPVMTVVGAEDAFAPMRYAHEVTEWVPELRGILVTLDGAGHFSFWENPREAVSVARGFIERYREFLEGPAEWQAEEEEAAPPLRFDPEAPR